MEFHSTILEAIEAIDDEEISYRNLHSNVTMLTPYGESVTIPYKAVTDSYHWVLMEEAAYIKELSPEEISIYRYNPKRLSLDMYGTTELWYLILRLNNTVSISEFSLVNGKVILCDEEELMEILNEIMILEEIVE